MTRAYFTAATCAILLFIILSVNTPSKLFPIKIRKFYLKNKIINNKELTIYKDDIRNLVPFNYNKFYIKLRKGVLSKQERELMILNKEQQSIIVGLILGDGWIQKRKGWNPRIGLKQSMKNFHYLWTVFVQLSSLCSNYPWLVKNRKRGKLFYAIEFQTRQLNCINEIYSIFYSENNKKSIKFELYEYLDYIAIAHWIMCDGSKRNKGITLCTDSFSFKEVVILMNILIIKYNIKSSIHLEKNKPRIYINRKELNKLLNYIEPYFVKTFLYKLFL